MQPDQPRTVAELTRIARQTIDSLRAAGIEWAPNDDQPIQMSIVPQVEEVVIDPLEQTRIELQTLAAEVADCAKCSSLAATRAQTVFGVGKIEPEVCFIGEAPGGEEDEAGEPFVGPAGQLLNRIIAACGMRREEVYICNIIKCRPPMNRTPTIEEANNCNGFLLKQLELVNPQYICALGGTAAMLLLGTTQGVGRLRGKILDWNGIPVVVTYHPAYLLPHRAQTQQEVSARKKMVWDDMKFLLEKMGRTVEKKSS